MDSVPVLDLSRAGGAPVRALDAACREWGFFQVTGHGLDPALGEALLVQMHRFFALAPERKRAVERSARNAWGFYDRELTKNARDWKEIFDVGPPGAEGPLSGHAPQWPEGLPGFRETVEAFSTACEALARRLLAAVALALGQRPEVLAAGFGPDHTSFLRLNHYPRCPDPAPPDAPTRPLRGELGIHHHTDAGALTVLLQDEQPGLQVLREGVWHTVEPRRDALVINIGDVVQVWSNDRYPAPLHRVLASAESARFSAPYFFNPCAATRCAPLVGPPHYRPIEWGEFRARRAAGDYADLGPEVQISDYRIEGAEPGA